MLVNFINWVEENLSDWNCLQLSAWSVDDLGRWLWETTYGDLPDLVSGKAAPFLFGQVSNLTDMCEKHMTAQI